MLLSPRKNGLTSLFKEVKEEKDREGSKNKLPFTILHTQSELQKHGFHAEAVNFLCVKESISSDKMHFPVMPYPLNLGGGSFTPKI